MLDRLAPHPSVYERFIEASLARTSDLRGATAPETYRLGPVGFAVHFVGATLQGLFGRAIAPLREAGPPEDPERWTIDAVDGSAVDWRPPDEWSFPVTSFDNQLCVHVDDRNRIVAADPERGLWSIADIPARRGLYWVKDSATLPDWEPGAPFRLLLHILTQAAGLQLVHAAGLLVNGRGLLLAGPGGSGKSTTTFALMAKGAATVGEDFVVLAPGAPPRALALYDTIKLTGLATELFPSAVSRAANPNRGPEDKARMHLLDLMPDRLLADIPVHAVISLRLAHAPRTIIRPGSEGASMRALAPSSAFLLRVRMAETIARVGALVRSVPAFDADLSRDPLEAADAIMAFAEGLPR